MPSFQYANFPNAKLPKPDEPEPNCRSGYARHGGRSPPYGRY